MNANKNYKIKETKNAKEKNVNSEKIFENSNIFNSILKRKLNTHNAMKSLNSEISNKIKDNLALDIFNNNGITLSSLLSKKNYNGALIEGNNTPKPIAEQTQTIEINNPHHYFHCPINEVSNDGINYKKNKINDNNHTEETFSINDTFENNNINKKINNPSYHSPFIIKKDKKREAKGNKKKIDEVIINYIIDKSSEKKDSKEEANETIKNISYINDISGKNNTLKNVKKEEIIEGEKGNINQGIKIYKKKPLKITKNNKENSSINNTNISNGKKEYEINREQDKYDSILNNYRKRIIKQFMFHFKPYYYSLLKNHFHTFILKVKNLKNYNEVTIPKRYIKRINRRNINDTRIRDLKLVQFNYENYNLTNLSNNNTDNSNNYVNLYNSKKLQSEKDFSNPSKKINYFLMNNNRFNFSSKGSAKKNELFRNNYELLKKYSQIIKRKKRKNILVNEKRNDNYSYSQLRNENHTIDIYSTNKQKYSTFNNSLEKKYKDVNNTLVKEHVNLYNSISNGEKAKEDKIKIENNDYNIIYTIPREEKTKDNRIKGTILKIKKKEKRVYPDSALVPGGSVSLKKNGKRNHSKTSINKMDKKHNKIIMVRKKEKINSINNSIYNKNYISKKIKNIFTIDRKINIYINYVFFIPQETKTKKDLEKLNKLLRIKRNYSYTYLAKENSINKFKKKIHSRKKLTSIKEEEEKSKCSISMSMIFQNSRAIEEYNSIINCLVKKIDNYLILKKKKSLIYKLKVINLIISIKEILRYVIFKKIKSIKNKEIKENNQNAKLNDLNGIFLVDDKIIMNMNNVNYEKNN